MSKKELIARELDQLPEQDLDRLFVFLRVLQSEHSEKHALLAAAETSLAKDWLTPEEDAAWADL